MQVIHFLFVYEGESEEVIQWVGESAGVSSSCGRHEDTKTYLREGTAVGHRLEVPTKLQFAFIVAFCPEINRLAFPLCLSSIWSGRGDLLPTYSPPLSLCGCFSLHFEYHAGFSFFFFYYTSLLVVLCLCQHLFVCPPREPLPW